MKETEKTKALRALIIRRAGQKEGYVREKGTYSEGTMFKLISVQPSTRASVVYATKGGA